MILIGLETPKLQPIPPAPAGPGGRYPFTYIGPLETICVPLVVKLFVPVTERLGPLEYKIAPVGAVDKEIPEGPVGPVKPVNPWEPVGPVAPVTEPAPAGPVGPTDPAGPAGPSLKETNPAESPLPTVANPPEFEGT